MSTHQEVWCTDCDAMLSGFEKESVAIAAWNTRPIEDELRAENAILRKSRAAWVAIGEKMRRQIDTLEAENERLKKKNIALAADSFSSPMYNTHDCA